ncbi:hypothetical protein TNCV_3432771 [Trichonephila clavipes]|nr:hypothetical protein TNCV_3432771 [Trichonephila clavipes]
MRPISRRVCESSHGSKNLIRKTQRVEGQMRAQSIIAHVGRLEIPAMNIDMSDDHETSSEVMPLRRSQSEIVGRQHHLLE